VPQAVGSEADRATMKVLFLIDSLGTGGAEKSTAAMLPPLRERGLDVSVVLLYHTNEGSECDLREAGISVEILKERRQVARVREFRRLLSSVKPDILHTALYAADQVGRLAALGMCTHVVSSIVTVPRTYWPSSGIPIWKSLPVDLFDMLTAWTCVDRFHAVTDGVGRLSAESHRAPRRRIVTVERGRDPRELGEPGQRRRIAVRIALGLPGDAEIVIGVGRQEPQKDFTGLLEAIALVLRRRSQVHLLLVGPRGTDSHRIEAVLASETLFKGRVHVLGHRTDVADLLCASDVFVLSSHCEGAAGVVLEAMKLHVPIVATRLDGLEGILQDGRNALTVNVGDSGALSKAIELSLVDRAGATERTSAAGEDFENRFTIDRAADQMVKMYVSVVDGSHARVLRARCCS